MTTKRYFPLIRFVRCKVYVPSEGTAKVAGGYITGRLKISGEDVRKFIEAIQLKDFNDHNFSFSG